MNKQIKKGLAIFYVYIGAMGILLAASDVAEIQKSVIEDEHNVTAGIILILNNNTENISENTNNIDITKADSMVEETYRDGWTITEVNVRKSASEDSEILDTLSFDEEVSFLPIENEEWVEIQYNDETAYISSQYVSTIRAEYEEFEIPNYSGFKSWMGYKTITSTSSQQYVLQNTYAYTGNYGIRMVNGRYCVALGTHFNAGVGQCVDLVLDNGEVIPCVIGDIKDNKHTDGNNIFTTASNCCSEFIVDSGALDGAAKSAGSISAVSDSWDSPVKYIRVYSKNVLD